MTMMTIDQQCLQTHKTGGWFDHSPPGLRPVGPEANRGVIEVGGADRIQFLHNILTNDIKKLTPGTGAQACLLTAQAKMIAAVNVLCFEDLVWLAFDYVLRKPLIEALEKFVIMEQVVLKDLSDELKLFSVHGPKAKNLMTPFAQNLPKKMLSHVTSIVRSNGQLNIIRMNLVGKEGYGILCPKSGAESVKKLIEERASSLGIVKLEPAAVEIMRIGSAIPKYGVDYDETSIPLECRLDHTISFTKGCFPGQEIIARLDSRGGVSKKLCGLALKGEVIPKKNDRILDGGAETGHITSAAFLPNLKKTVALGYLKKESWTVGHSLMVQAEQNQIPARVEELPFYSK